MDKDKVKCEMVTFDIYIWKGEAEIAEAIECSIKVLQCYEVINGYPVILN